MALESIDTPSNIDGGEMKTLGYFQDLRGWQMENGRILSMSPDAKEEDVIAEEERLQALQVILEGAVDVPSVTEVGPAIDERTPDEKLDAAITEYIAATGTKEEDVAMMVMDRVPWQRKEAFLVDVADTVALEKDIESMPIDTGIVVEKPIDIVKAG